MFWIKQVDTNIIGYMLMERLLDFTVTIGLWLLIVSVLVENELIQAFAVVMSL